MCVSPGDHGRVLVASGGGDNTVRLGENFTAELSDFSLVWSTRSLHQSLDCRGARLVGVIGLTEVHVRLLKHCGATGVRLLDA